MTQLPLSNSARPLLYAVYGVALAFVLPSLMEFGLVTFPYRFGEASWRFGAAGLFYNSVVVSPLFGLALAAITGYLLEQRAVMRVASIIAFLMAVLLIVSFPFFVLDFLQLRKQVNPQGRDGYDYVSLKAVLTGGVMALAALGVGIGAWKSSRMDGSAPARSRSSRKTAAGNLVVGSQPTA